MNLNDKYTHLSVLDKGYVRLIDVLGDDLSVANAARVSYDKTSHEMSEKDANLIRFLWDEGHTSPFRHAALTFEVYAPLMVARQHWKYAVSSTFVDDQNGWNESSRRYITEEPTFHVPYEWRTAPANSKQGSGEPLDLAQSIAVSELLESHIRNSEELYELAMSAGICAEQARLFLPAYGMYVRYRWTVSLHAVMHFIAQRMEHTAQVEIQAYASAILDLAQEASPFCMQLLENK